MADSATEIGIHEMAHTAFGLADEYPYYYAGDDETGQDHHPGPEPGEPNVTIKRNRASLEWRWAVDPVTAVPTMTNPDCSTEDSRPSPIPAGTAGTFEGAHYYHCGAFRPEFACKMLNLGVPFCRICRQVIWNRIGPLAALTARARTPITVVDRYPEHLNVFAVASDGRTYPTRGIEAVAGPAGSTSWAGTLRRAVPAPQSPPSRAMRVTLTCSRSAPTTGSGARGGVPPVAGRAGSSWARWWPEPDQQ